jgi:putative ABC transport system permease protein
LRDLYPDDNGNIASPRVLKLQDEVVGSYREGLWLILAAVVVVLLIACANLASFQLARAALRHKEMAIRAALGAKRKVLMRQVLTESMLLAILGGALGLLLSFWAKDLLLAMSPADFPRASAVSIDGRVLLFSLLVTLFAGLALGLAPAIQHTRTDLNSELKDGGRDGAGASRNRVRSLFIVSEIALSLMLLVAAGLLLRSFSQLRGVNPGFDANHVLAVRLSLPAARYSNGASVKTFYDQIAARVAGLPGVESVSAASALPLSGMIARTTFNIAGRTVMNPSEQPFAQHRWVGPGYFETMKIPMVRGRDIADSDNEHAAGAIIIDQALQRQFFAGQDPLGVHVFINMGDGNPPREYEVVGIVEDVKHMGLTDEPMPTLYGAIPQAPKSAVPFMANNLSLVVRTGIGPEALASTIRKELRNVDVDVATAGVRPMQQLLTASVAARRFNLQLIGVFAVTALLLAAAGLYAVIAYLVSQRTREIGLRLALGATPRHVLRLMIFQGMKLTLIGVAIGIVGAIIVTRLMRSLLFGVAPTDLVTFGIAAVVLIVVALLACFIPARRATRVDPLVALRYE